LDKLAPIILFVYNRPWHTRQTIEALQKNELAKNSEIFIYSDAAKNDLVKKSVYEVRDYLETVNGFKKVTIVKREKNFGLANSIIDGVTKIVNEYEKIIVLEDDLVTSPYFLKFMNESLEMYKDNLEVASIHGYIYPIDNLPNTFFIKGADCWGWSTWKRAWRIFEPDGKKLLVELKDKKLEKEADFNNSSQYTQMLINQINGNNNSWAVRWYMSAFLKNMLTLYSGKSYVQNIGNDSSGTHCEYTNQYKVDLLTNYSLKKINVIEDKISRSKMEIFFNSLKLTFTQRLKQKIVGFFK